MLMRKKVIEINFTLNLESYLQTYRYKYLALYHALRNAIHDDTLRQGDRLPSSRELASLYGMSRGSVSQVYDMLRAEGYINAVMGGATYVAYGLPAKRTAEQLSVDVELSSWGKRMLEWDLGAKADIKRENIPRKGPESLISFQDTPLPKSLFPYQEWKSALAFTLRSGSEFTTHVHDPRGDEGLRSAIASYVRRNRGITADAEQICLFNGSMQAIAILSQLLLEPGKRAVLEDPCYYGISKAVHTSGGTLIAAPVDEQGIIPQAWDARLLFVTPGRQFPTGAVLSASRRRELLTWANEQNAIIIEDDYDSEYRSGGKPLEPLKALDVQDRVVYIGSFSKTMFASLRIGYAVLPRSLIDPVRAAKALYEPASPMLLEQQTLARFINRGDYERHMRRLRRIFGAKYDLFYKEMTSKLSHLFRVYSSEAGVHVYGEWLGTEQQYSAFRVSSNARGVEFRDANVYRLTTGRSAACFCFAHLEQGELVEGVDRMKKAWNDLQ